MMHRGQARSARMRINTKHMKVMSAPVRGHQEHAAGVKFERYDGIRVSHEVGDHRVVRLLAVLTVIFVVALQIFW